MIHIQTNTRIPAYKEMRLKKQLGKAIQIIPEKSEEQLMLLFEENCHMYFQGEDGKPIAFVMVKLYGHAEQEYYNRLTREITLLMCEELQLSSDCLFIAYDELPQWGWKGETL